MNPSHFSSPASWLAAFLFACAYGLIQAAPAQAQSTNKASASQTKTATPAASKKPVEEPDTTILSDSLNYDDVKKESTFTGNIIMTRGLMTLRSDKLVLTEDAEGFQYGTATVEPGKLVYIRQENPEKFEVIEAKGLRAEYNGKTNEIDMIGKAIVTRFVCGKPFDTIKGERVKYYEKSSTYQAFGGPNSAAKDGRVRSVTQPRAQADAAAAACRQKSVKH
jgi:lipopolysaccharide export system protein LptA